MKVNDSNRSNILKAPPLHEGRESHMTLFDKISSQLPTSIDEASPKVGLI